MKSIINAFRKFFYTLLLVVNIKKEEKSKPLNKKIKIIRRLISIKQYNGHHKRHYNADQKTVCLNCGHVFTGNYCNICGQNKSTSRYSFHSIFSHILEGMTHIEHGFGYTLLALICRPGYMIRDYIAGKRINYYRPFQLLFILAAVYILLVHIVDPKAIEKEKNKDGSTKSELVDAYHEVTRELSNTFIKGKEKEVHNKKAQAIIQASKDSTHSKNFEQTTDSIQRLIQQKVKEDSPVSNSVEEEEDESTFHSPFLKSVEEMLTKWAHGNKAASILLMIPVFAFATRGTFRKHKNDIFYNTTEHIFIQAFIACQILLVSIICLPFNGKADLDSLYDLPAWAIFILYTYSYKQLFMNGWWKSIRKTLVMFIYSLFTLIVLAIIAVLFIILIGLVDNLFC